MHRQLSPFRVRPRQCLVGERSCSHGHFQVLHHSQLYNLSLTNAVCVVQPKYFCWGKGLIEQHFPCHYEFNCLIVQNISTARQ